MACASIGRLADAGRKRWQATHGVAARQRKLLDKLPALLRAAVIRAVVLHNARTGTNRGDGLSRCHRAAHFIAPRSLRSPEDAPPWPMVARQLALQRHSFRSRRHECPRQAVAPVGLCASSEVINRRDDRAEDAS